jgi:hypothetical protein
MPLFLLALALLLAPGRAAAIQVSEGGGEVPPVHEKLFKELARDLQAFADRLAEVPDSGPGPRYFAALTTADGLRGRALLEYGSMEGSRVMLDALRDLGVSGVKVDIPYPLLAPGQPLAREYLDFYARLAAEVRKRGLALYVSMTPAFRNPAFAKQKGDARLAALDRLAQVARAQAEAVLGAMQPDILGLVNEPSTAAENADLPELATGEGLARFLAAVTQDLARNGISMAAGLGAWEEPELAAALVAAPGMDILDIHVGALRSKKTDFLVQADEYAQLARLLGKRAVLGEVWLSKASTFELTARRLGGPAPGQEVFRRDVYGFWSPLDASFLRLMDRLARARGLDLVCPAWPRYLFSYLEYQSGLERTAYTALMRDADAAAFAAMRRDDLTRTGEALRQLIRAGRR